MAMPAKKLPDKVVFSENRKARHDYEILESFDGGLQLLGSEAKSVRNGGGKLSGAFVTFQAGELWLVGAGISRYAKAGNDGEYNPERNRKVLMRQKEIESLHGKIQQKGLTLVPLSLYSRGRHIKLNFGLCRGRKSYDKREKLKKQDLDRDARRESRE
jgi:SsrA-binding protein